MDLSRVIIGPVVTEKAERQKADGTPARSYTLWVTMPATKIEVKQALKKFYDVDAGSVRVMRTRAKNRQLGQGKQMEKRHAGKKVMVTLKQKSKALDLAAFQTTSS
jgi:ribosomal protein L23